MKSLLSHDKEAKTILDKEHTDGRDHSDGEEEALAQAPVAPVQVSPPRADAPVEDLLQQPLQVSRGHVWVSREELALAELDIRL